MEHEETRVDISEKYVLLSNIMYDRDTLSKKSGSEKFNDGASGRTSWISEDKNNYHLDLFLPTDNTLTEHYRYKYTKSKTDPFKLNVSDIQKYDIKQKLEIKQKSGCQFDTMKIPADVLVPDDGQLENDSLETITNTDEYFKQVVPEELSPSLKSPNHHLIRKIVPREQNRTLQYPNQSESAILEDLSRNHKTNVSYDPLNKERILHLHKVSSANIECSNMGRIIAGTPLNIQPEYSKTKPPLPPLVVFIHGGGWRRGDRLAWKYFTSFSDTNVLIALVSWAFNLYHNIGITFVMHGIACAIISYPKNRLEFPWLLLEVFTSYVCNVIVFSVLYGILLCVLSCMPYYPFSTSFDPPNLLQMLCFTNTCILVLMTFFRKNYQLETRKMPFLWVPFGTVLFLISIAIAVLAKPLGDFAALYFYASLVLTQGVIVLNTMRTTTAKQPSQALACVQAVRFLSDFGMRTSNFDIKNIFLMGHSAGAHLATLVTLDSELSANLPHIKGVISVSGIHNLSFLSSWFLTKHLYLKPTFGNKPVVWSQASPITHVTKISSPDEKPAFLVISGEKERKLREDADNFHRKLVCSGFTSERFVVQNSGHFKVILMFMQYAPKCVNFIYSKYSRN